MRLRAENVTFRKCMAPMRANQITRITGDFKMDVIKNICLSLIKTCSFSLLQFLAVHRNDRMARPSKCIKQNMYPFIYHQLLKCSVHKNDLKRVLHIPSPGKF